MEYLGIFIAPRRVSHHYLFVEIDTRQQFHDTATLLPFYLMIFFYKLFTGAGANSYKRRNTIT